MMLSPYRVLDLTDERGQLTGSMLAQLGAEVILVEPPGGARSRSMAPFIDDEPGPENSLRHHAYNRGKASVVLDLAESEADRAALLQLAATADVIIESAETGELDDLGLGWSDLQAVNPTLVYTSISAFGRTGPKATWAATDLTVWASAGPSRITGDSDRAPLRTPGGQAFIHAAAEAAGATIAALYERASSGSGQHVDVSAQQASAQATQSNVLARPNGTAMPMREAGGLRFTDELFIQLLWPCADGFVSVTFLFGTALGVPSDRLMQLLLDMGFVDEATRNKDWIGYGEALLTGEEPVSEYERVKDRIGDFCMAHTKAELLELGTTHKLLIAPVNMVDDVASLEQLSDRDFWDDVEGIRYPGPFAKASVTPLVRTDRATTIGADTARILSATSRPPANEPPSGPSPSTRLPLEGVKILDFMWVMAGPAGTRVLTDLGATVVRIESVAKIDPARTLQPFKNGENALETSTLFANMNAGKLDFTVNPTTPEGQAVIRDLVLWADVVTESFSPRAMQGFGLTYETLREINPDIVMLSSCLFGQTGPLSMFAGYGTMAAAMTGFFGITGWSDRPPSGPFGAYTDYISPRFANAALLAALDHRRRTGQGQYIDFAQAEGSLHALATYFLDLSVNGRVASHHGNDDSELAPHGVFASDGDDTWIALACRTDEQRSQLKALTGGLDDASIATWIAARDDDTAEAELQAAGIPAHRIATETSLLEDPQLVHRQHWRTVPHASLGEITVEGPRFTMSRTPPTVGPVPTLGEHTSIVLTDILDYDDNRMVELLISGALE